MARIIVVDDEPHVIRLLEAYLERAGHAVLGLSDPAQALEAMRREPPDLLVIDTMMPEVNGAELQWVIAADPLLRAVPVVMLSGRSADAAHLERVIPAGYPYVTKPFNPNEVVQLVNRLLSFPPESSNDLATPRERPR